MTGDDLITQNQWLGLSLKRYIYIYISNIEEELLDSEFEGRAAAHLLPPSL